MMILSVCSVVAYADTTPSASYYVKSGGTGNGKTADTPAPTVAAAVATMNEDGHGAGEVVNIYLMHESLTSATIFDGYHNLPAWRDAAAGEKMPAYTAKIVV